MTTELSQDRAAAPRWHFRASRKCHLGAPRITMSEATEHRQTVNRPPRFDLCSIGRVVPANISNGSPGATSGLPGSEEAEWDTHCQASRGCQPGAGPVITATDPALPG